MRISDWSSDVCSSDLPAIGLEQDRGAQELVAVPPIAGAARRAASAQDAFVQAVELFAVLGRLQSLLAARRRRPGLQPRFDRRILRIEMGRSEEHTSELQSLMRISYAVFCLKKKKNHK